MSAQPRCETCGETVHEVLCGMCGAWWVENSSELTMLRERVAELEREIEMMHQDAAGESL